MVSVMGLDRTSDITGLAREVSQAVKARRVLCSLRRCSLENTYLEGSGPRVSPALQSYAPGLFLGLLDLFSPSARPADCQDIRTLWPSTVSSPVLQVWGPQLWEEG